MICEEKKYEVDREKIYDRKVQREREKREKDRQIYR